jgi:hypothetical protein
MASSHNGTTEVGPDEKGGNDAAADAAATDDTVEEKTKEADGGGAASTCTTTKEQAAGEKAAEAAAATAAAVEGARTPRTCETGCAFSRCTAFTAADVDELGNNDAVEKFDAVMTTAEGQDKVPGSAETSAEVRTAVYKELVSVTVGSQRAPARCPFNFTSKLTFPSGTLLFADIHVWPHDHRGE